MDSNRTKQKLSLGIGCKKGVTVEELYYALQVVFQKHSLRLEEIKIISSIDIKKNEKGLLKLSKQLNKPITFYAASVLSKVEVLNSSSFVNKITGTKSVAESAAILSSVDRILAVPKEKFKNITVAVAL